MFLIGVITGGFATLTTYLTQLALFNEAVGRTLPKWQRTHVFGLRLSVVLMIAGVLVFAAGSLWAVARLQ